jgi:dipeptidyl aminopeptidase/acylaminoacyl peptidase
MTKQDSTGLGNWWWVLAVLILFPAWSGAQGTLEDYKRAAGFQTGAQRKQITDAHVFTHWIEKTSRFWYRTSTPEGSQFVLVDAAQNTSAPAFDHARLAAGLSAATKQEYKPEKLPFDNFEYTDGGKSITLHIGKNKWVCSLADYKCAPGAEDEKDPYEELSPDGIWAAFVKDYNLYLRNVSTGQTALLTQDGEASWDYATELPSLGLLREQGVQNIRQHAAVFWAPDSSKLVTYRLDSRNSGRFTSLQFVPPDQLRPKAFTYVYPLPGETLATAQPIIFEVPSGRRIDVKSPPLELPFQEGPGFSWFEDSKSIFYDYYDRGSKSVELRTVDPATGEQKVVIREQADTYVDPGETFYRFLRASGEVLWTSERDGWNHLYLYNEKTGAVVRQLTQGSWVVRGIEAIDEKNRRVYFLACGREKGEDPYLTHLYSIGLDGSGLTLLSPENADHAVSVSPDNVYFIDSYSRPDAPGLSVLRRLKDGGDVCVLIKGDAGHLLATGWKYPEAFQGKSADGKYDLYALIWRPSNFDAAKKYPIIEHVYTGPQAFFVPKSFGSAVMRDGLQATAELGFVVVMIDGRGTTGRSRAFHEFSYRNLGGAFEDHVAMIKQMAEKYPYMDVSRVGIFGTSAGGYGAAHAMLVFPDLYKVGVTISGDHDARLDKAWWNELYQGYPVKEDYTAQSNVTMASRLEGHLLIEHGDMDDNVHPVETMRFVDALIKAGKDFDMLFVPNMPHGEGNNYLVRRRWDYFVQHLAGVTPPRNFEIKAAEDSH